MTSLEDDIDLFCSLSCCFATTADTATLCACEASELTVSGETASITVHATLCTDFCVKIATVTSFVSLSSFHTASFSSSHFRWSPLLFPGKRKQLNLREVYLSTPVSH